MKTIRLLFEGAFLTGLLLFIAGCATHMTARPEPIIATIDRLKGEARYSQAGNAWIPLKKGAVFNAGITIQTARKSFVDITFDRRESPVHPVPTSSPRYTPISPETPLLQSMRIFENTSLKINQAAKDEIRMHLYAGEICGFAAKSTNDPVYQVIFTNGVATISSDTIYAMSASGIMDVLRGTASVFLADKNTTYKLTSHQAFDPTSAIVSELTESQLPEQPGLPFLEPKVVPAPNIKQGMGGSMRKF